LGSGEASKRQSKKNGSQEKEWEKAPPREGEKRRSGRKKENLADKP